MIRTSANKKRDGLQERDEKLFVKASSDNEELIDKQNI